MKASFGQTILFDVKLSPQKKSLIEILDNDISPHYITCDPNVLSLIVSKCSYRD